jgi:hypothetical protein
MIMLRLSHSHLHVIFVTLKDELLRMIVTFLSSGNPLVCNDVVQRLAAGHFLGVPQCRECPKILPKTHWAVLLIVDHVS